MASKIKYPCIKDGRLYVATEYQKFPPLIGFLEWRLEDMGCTDIQHKMECKYQDKSPFALYRYVIHCKVPDRWPKEADVEIIIPNSEGGTVSFIIIQRSEDIDNLPTIDHESLRPHGRWIQAESAGGQAQQECSCCGSKWPEYARFFAYCPYCGAKMED